MALGGGEGLSALLFWHCVTPDALDSSLSPPPPSHITTAGRRFSPLRTHIPTSDCTTAGACRATVLPACQAAKSQPLDVGLDWCSTLNEQRASRDHKILETKRLRFWWGMFIPQAHAVGVYLMHGQANCGDNKTVIIASDLWWNIIARQRGPAAPEQTRRGCLSAAGAAAPQQWS